jgi:hypothetical protein
LGLRKAVNLFRRLAGMCAGGGGENLAFLSRCVGSVCVARDMVQGTLGGLHWADGKSNMMSCGGGLASETRASHPVATHLVSSGPGDM